MSEREVLILPAWAGEETGDILGSTPRVLANVPLMAPLFVSQLKAAKVVQAMMQLFQYQLVEGQRVLRERLSGRAAGVGRLAALLMAIPAAVAQPDLTERAKMVVLQIPLKGLAAEVPAVVLRRPVRIVILLLLVKAAMAGMVMAVLVGAKGQPAPEVPEQHRVPAALEVSRLMAVLAPLASNGVFRLIAVQEEAAEVPVIPILLTAVLEEIMVVAVVEEEDVLVAVVVARPALLPSLIFPPGM
ncbi:MAG: hypothetical protein HYS88_01955 [Candidatus Colwellbacteria bacterium]|nr:hypothetical protein [Candidatus Colwellbacteria bacterium]